MKKLLSLGFAVSLALSGVSTVISPIIVQANSNSYADYSGDQYWSEDMLWSIEKGLINGYANVKNAKTGKLENLLKPGDTLTEAQTLAVLYRYFDPEDLDTTVPDDPNWWASVSYQLAKRDGLKTVASSTNKSGSNQGTTRGELAEYLASLHFGKSVSEREAIQFMYDKDISSGYPDKNGIPPKTYESYGANNILQRAHIVAFVKRYHDYVDSASKWTRGIKTRYGNTYGTDNQQQYDAVMKVVDSAVANGRGQYKLGDGRHQYYMAYLNGARWDGDRGNESLENRALYEAERSLKHLVEAGISLPEIESVYEASKIAIKAIGGTTGGQNGASDSAYDALILKVSDCDADAQAIVAIFDALGFKTVIQFGTGDAKAYVILKGERYIITNGTPG